MKKRIFGGMVLLSVLTAAAVAVGLALLWEHGLYRPETAALLILAVLLGDAIAAYYTANAVVAPLRGLHLNQPANTVVYEELRPLLQHVKQQSRQIDDQVAELRERQREFTAMTEHMREGLVVVNDQGYILSINACAMRILGLQDGIQYEKQHILMAKQNPELQTLVDEGLEGHHRDRILAIDGRMYQIVTNPIGPAGQMQGVVLLLLDVTEKQQQEQMRREFTANVSHELRTPLTAISGYAEIMMHGLVSAENVQPFAEKIYKEANRLITLIADIIQLSQLDEVSEQFQWEQVDMAQLAEEVVQRLQQKAEANQVRMSVYTEPTVMTGIQQVLQEIVYNLCDNAIKYNRPEGTVKVSVVRSGSNAVLKVVDTGIGIAPEDQPRIFERFYRADKSHSRLIGGTGLGLSIVKHGIQLHHGEVHLESTLGTGTAITVRLPIEPQEG